MSYREHIFRKPAKLERRQARRASACGEACFHHGSLTMADRFAKSRPWRATLNRTVTVQVGFLSVLEPLTGAESVIAPPVTIELGAGERMFRTKGEALAFVAAHRRDSGADCVSDVYKAEI
jgi:hypothetical protein